MRWAPGRFGLFLSLGAFLLLIILGVFLNSLRTPEHLASTIDLESRGTALKTVTLYYLEPDSLAIVEENRQVTLRGEKSELARRLVRYLAEGGDAVRSPLPEGTRLVHYFELEDGAVILDFSSELIQLSSGGILEDRMRLQAFLRTLMENLAPIESMRILVEGRPLSLWGDHIRLDPVLLAESWQ
ncbi:MAG: GerMN domain-containing protein [Candidatus Eisenbacteria bacterium]|uniref:GerMN domain-containing protein n=1 Tax=Eiseniibacteriota bacterium TaxID=2212470 RepID=A0A7Y2E6P5_UNCEI|nr:GerMN domain-containing protein [Candidatus Eisenbacteria bacterium]